ncbi:MAG: tetratricopeptide repeat protein [Eubacteriales bacterium]
MSQNKKNILKFNQDDKFYYQRAMKLLDDMEFARGIKMLNIAIKQQPENIEYRMSLCDALTDIGYYSKSIDEVINIMVLEEDIDPKCYFMLGHNYYELGDYIKALNMFERYLSENPEGDLSEDVYFFLDNIEEMNMTSWEEHGLFPSHIYSTKSDITNIDETRISDDIETWAKEQNIKALMAYSKQEYEETTKICRNILSKMPRQSSVQCTLALSLYKEGGIEESKELAKGLAENVTTDIDDLFRVSFVVCELEMDEYAQEVLKKLKAYMPYSEKINHFLAISYYNCGDYENARKLWQLCYEINFDSHKYKWYIDNTYDKNVKRLKYSNVLPTAAVLENIRYLEKLLAEKEEKPNLNLWENEKFKMILLESLEKCTEDVQSKLLHIIYDYANEQREGIFRKFLLSDYISEKNKNEILSFLHHMDAKEPFLMMTDFQLVDVAINVISVDNKSKSEFVQALNIAINTICENKKEKDKLIALWTNAAIKFMIENKRIKNILLWAYGFYSVAMEDDYSLEELVEKAKAGKIKKASLINVINEIKAEKDKKDDN